MSMFGGNAVPSLADIAAVTGNNNGNNDGLNGNNGWWILIILFALLGGWGRNGNGNNGDNGNGGGTTVVTVPMPSCCGYGGYGGSGSGYSNGFFEAAIQRGFDNQSVIQKLDGLSNGVCSLGYDQLAQMKDASAQAMQNANALSTQISDCCCKTQTGLMNVVNQADRNACDIVNAINQATRDIMQNDNQNYRQLHDENIQIQMQAYRDQIAAKDSMINALNLSASQSNQNQYIDAKIDALYDRLSPCPRPAYVVDNPNCCRDPWERYFDNRSGNCCTGRNSCCG